MSEQKSQAMAVMRNANANIVGAPTAVSQQIDPFRKATLTQVFISPNPDDKEVYEQGKELALTKVGLEKLAIGASMKFRTIESVSTVDYCKVVVEGLWTNANGETIGDKKTSEIYLDDIKDEIMSRPKKKAWDTDEKRMNEFRQFRRFKLQRCESSAKNRVIRSLLGLKNTYTAQELTKPFAFPVVHFAPDFSDPEIKQAAIQKFMGQSETLYGADTENQSLPEPVAPVAQEIPENVAPETGEIIADSIPVSEVQYSEVGEPDPY